MELKTKNTKCVRVNLCTNAAFYAPIHISYFRWFHSQMAQFIHMNMKNQQEIRFEFSTRIQHIHCTDIIRDTKIQRKMVLCEVLREKVSYNSLIVKKNIGKHAKKKEQAVQQNVDQEAEEKGTPDLREPSEQKRGTNNQLNRQTFRMQTNTRAIEREIKTV